MTYNELIRNFPGTPRPQQDAALHALATWIDSGKSSDVRYFGCDAPTGVGKSFLALSLAKTYQQMFGGQVWVVTQNKLLQDQYVTDFPKDLFCLKGLDNYSCHEDRGKTCGQSKCGRIRAPEGEPAIFPKYCTRNCEYDQAVKAGRMAPVLLLNAAKAFNILKTHGRSMQPWIPKLMIYDEGHSIEPQLDNEASLVIKPEELRKINLDFNEYFDQPDVGPVPGLVERLGNLKIPVGKIYQTEFFAPSEHRDTPKLKKAENLLNKLDEVLSNLEDLGIEYVNAAQDHLDLRPLQIFPIFKQFIKFPTVFMSATLLSKKGFCSTIGVPEEEMSWISVDSPFPIENRKVHNAFSVGSASLNFGNQDQQAPIVMDRIREILNGLHPNDKGIIHTHTYKWAMKIFELNREFDGRLLYPRSAPEQKDMLKRHAESSNTVLLSPSMTEGVDLKEDLARFTCLVKVPYLPIQDPVVKARMELDETWYGYRSIMTMIQASGRGVRSKEDWCSIYLLDPGFVKFINRYKYIFPPWFLSAYQKGKYALRV